MKRAAFLVLTLCGGLCPAFAADAPASKTNTLLGRHDSNQPINIAADKVTADLNNKTVIYTGNVVVTQGDIRMHADGMKVATAEGKADKIYADGKVVVDSPASGTATGDAGTYDVPNHQITLTGHHVVLVHNKDVSSGTKLTVNLVTDVATFVSDKAQGGNGRVQGTFTPTGGN
jgi:lipopolysaccharide export system protein LptA